MKRFHELDALRGIAALTVVFSHLMGLYYFNIEDTAALSFAENWYKYSPIHIFWAGHEAVLFFFILSGFVLTLPFLKKSTDFSYKNYLIKRSARIYIPAIVAVCFAFLLKHLVPNNEMKTGNEWIDGKWVETDSISNILSHFFLIGEFNPHLLSVLWSLTHEMRISIIFPILVFLLFRFNWKIVLLVNFALSIFAVVIIQLTGWGIADTLFYVSFFVIGSLLAMHKDYLISLFNSLNFLAKMCLGIFAVLAYTFRWYSHNLPFLDSHVLHEWMTVLGASLFIIISLASVKISNILNLKPFQFLGNISYSLYMYHFMILIFFAKVLDGVIPTFSIFILILVTSLVASWLSFKYVEEPSMKLGRKLTRSRVSPIESSTP